MCVLLLCITNLLPHIWLCFRSRKSPSNTLVGSHGMGYNRPMWNLSFNCQLCPCSWSQHPLKTGLPISIEMPAQFCRSSASFYMVFVLCVTTFNTAACLSFYPTPPLFFLLAFILLFVSSTVLFIYLPSLCALSQGSEQCLSAENSLCYHVIVKRAPIQSQGNVFLKEKLCYPQLCACTALCTVSPLALLYLLLFMTRYESMKREIKTKKEVGAGWKE